MEDLTLTFSEEKIAKRLMCGVPIFIKLKV